MTTKIRKQIYLEKRQDRLLKRIAESRGVSEAEVIRGLIDAQAGSVATTPLPPDPAAWEAILQFIQQRAQSGVAGEPYRWNRDEIYEDRMSRFDRRINEAVGRAMPPVETPKRAAPRGKTRIQGKPSK